MNNQEDILTVKHDGDEPKNLYRIIYNLQIIQSLIFEYRKIQDSKLVLYVESKDSAPQSTGWQQPNKLEADNYDNDFPTLDKIDSSTSPKAAMASNIKEIREENIDDGRLQGNSQFLEAGGPSDLYDDPSQIPV